MGLAILVAPETGDARRVAALGGTTGGGVSTTGGGRERELVTGAAGAVAGRAAEGADEGSMRSASVLLCGDGATDRATGSRGGVVAS